MLRTNDTGRWTKPSPAQYPHQWNWDSGFIAIGLATFDWYRALVEVESMLDARWRSGMVPHLHYDPNHIADYFPGPDRWPGATGQVVEAGELTSGITNPPVLAWAAARLAASAPEPELGRAFAARVLGPLTDWLRHLFRDRRLPGSPLVAVVHPWETGWDNSPRWDFLREAGLKPSQPYVRLDTRAVAGGQRPGARDYDAYIALAEIISGGGFELAAYRARTPFVVHDVLFDALTHRAALELNRLAEIAAAPPPFAEGELDEFRRAFEELHWDPRSQTYLDYDCQTGRRIEVETAAAAAATAGGLIPVERARPILERALAHPAGLPVATVPPGSDAFDPDLYWRGPVWLNVNWLVVEGLRQAGLAAPAAELARRSFEAFGAANFAEYLNPLTSKGRGIADFSWSAALALDLLDA